MCHDWFLLSPTRPSLLWTTPITSVQWLAMGEFWTSLSVERKLIKLTSFSGESCQDGFFSKTQELLTFVVKGNRHMCQVLSVFGIVLLASIGYAGTLSWRSPNSWVPQLGHTSTLRICKKKLWNCHERFGTAGFIRASSLWMSTVVTLERLPGGSFLCPGRSWFSQTIARAFTLQ